MANWCMILMLVSGLGCWALIVLAFELISVRRQGGHLTVSKRDSSRISIWIIMLHYFRYQISVRGEEQIG